jgi:3-methyladenine DNA glycosylase AlkD
MAYTVKDIIRSIKGKYNKKNVEGMARFGINPNNTYGVSIPVLRGMARKIGKDHKLALKLWDTGIHEARLLAGFIDDKDHVSEAQLEKWVKDFDSWDVCDLVCSNVFDKTRYAYKKAVEWSSRKKEFVKRAGFVLMATLAVHDKKSDDKKFVRFFRIIKREAGDERNFVKKAVNWALRQIGKRSPYLNKCAIKVSGELKCCDSRSARWIGSDAMRELLEKRKSIEKRARK